MRGEAGEAWEGRFCVGAAVPSRERRGARLNIRTIGRELAWGGAGGWPYRPERDDGVEGCEGQRQQLQLRLGVEHVVFEGDHQGALVGWGDDRGLEKGQQQWAVIRA